MSDVTIAGEVPAALAHVSVTVTDLEKAKAFYGGVLGLPELPRPNFPGIPGVWYGLGAAMQLHIIVNEGLRRPEAERETFTISYPHFALAIRDADALADALGRAGVRFDEYRASPTGMRQLFLKDPDGNMVEFIGPGRATAAA